MLQANWLMDLNDLKNLKVGESPLANPTEIIDHIKNLKSYLSD